MKKVILMSFIFMLTACGSLYTVNKADGTEENGIYYYLPKNLVKITIPVTLINIESGTYESEIKNCFKDTAFNIPPIRKTGTTIKIGKPTFDLSSNNDETKRYFVNLKTPFNPFISRGGEFNLNQDQVLTSSKASSIDNSIDFVIGLAKIISTSGLASGGTNADPKVCNVQGIIDTLDKIRTGRLELITQLRASIDKELYLKMNSDLNNMEETIIGFFIGEKTITSNNIVIYIEPKKSWFLKNGIAKKSPLLKNIDLLKIKNHKIEFADTLEIISKNTYLYTGSTANKIKYDDVTLLVKPSINFGSDAKGKSGFVYRIPGNAIFSILNDNENIASEKLQIAQFGITKSLPKRFGLIKSEITDFILDPLTGGIQKLVVNGTSLGSDQISGINQVIKNKREDTTVSDLERKKAILTLQKEILELEEGSD